MQIYILSEKMKALKNFIFPGFKEGRKKFFFFSNIHGRIFFSGRFLA